MGELSLIAFRHGVSVLAALLCLVLLLSCKEAST